MTIPLFHVDAFTNKPFAGNPEPSRTGGPDQ